MPEIDQQHAIETYRSLIQISLEGFRLLALLNGGAAVAVLAYLGNIAGKGIRVPDMRCPMGCYMTGLVLCALSFIGSYETQLTLFNEAMGRTPSGRHGLWLVLSLGLVVLSLAAFALGSFLAVSALR